MPKNGKSEDKVSKKRSLFGGFSQLKLTPPSTKPSASKGSSRKVNPKPPKK